MLKTKTQYFQIALGGCVALSTLIQSTSAVAYNEKTHSRFVELAVRAMRLDQVALKNGASPEFIAYLEAVKAAPDNLGRLRVGFPRKISTDSIAPVPGVSSSKGFPFSTLDFDGRCNINDGERRNLNLIGRSALADFDMNVLLPADSEGCGLVGFGPDSNTSQEFLEGQSRNQRGMERALGWHAGIPDQRVDDSAAWIRPTLLGPGAVAFEAASQIWNYGAGTLALPLFALYALFAGEDFELDASYELAREYNPVDTVQGAIPGIGDFRSSMFTGLWHFETLDANVNGYNDIRGLWYPGAGAGGTPYPSSVDVAISALTVATGASLNAIAADGDNRYGQFDKVGRNWAQWQAHPMGLTEFSPLHNLARYGWERFLGSGATDAEGLGWPLHATGDACAPQHLISTTGWGHRPFENWASSDAGANVLFPPDDREAQLTRVIAKSFKWFSLLEDNGGRVHEFITQLAQQSRDNIRAEGDWPYANDGYSIAAFGSEPGWTHREYGRNVIGTEHEQHVRALAEDAMSASLGFLVFAASQVPIRSTAEEIACPPGQIFGPREEVRTLPCDATLTSNPECPTFTVSQGACVAPPGDQNATEPLPDSLEATSLPLASPDGGIPCQEAGFDCSPGQCCGSLVCDDYYGVCE